MSTRPQLSLAPVQGMTTTSFREAFVRLAGHVDDVYTPFLVTSATENAGEVLSRAFSGVQPWIGEGTDDSDRGHSTAGGHSATGFNPAERDMQHRARVIPQLLGNQGDEFRNYAHALAAMGFTEINWNIGCPYPMVTNKQRGSGLLPYPDRIREVLEVACADDSYGVSVKMRLGLESAEEGFAVMEVLNDYPLAGVILHARTGRQMYGGSVDPDAFASLAAVCRHVMTWNGDLFTVEDWRRVQEQFPAIDRFMLGRGALADPFLPAAIQGEAFEPEHKVERLRALHDAVFDSYREKLSGRHLCDRMKEFWTYLSVHVIADDRLLKKLYKAHTTESYLDALRQALDNAVWSEVPYRPLASK